jgi:hypothetical protein
MKELKWFRMWADAVDNPKLRLIAFEDRWHFVALCCLKRCGLIDKHDDPNRDRMIAVKLGVQVRDLEEIARRLIDVDLINDDLSPIGWDDRQFQSDADPTATERQRRHRNRMRNALVTRDSLGSDTDTDTDKTYVAKATDTALEKQILGAYHELLPNLPAVKIWSPENRRQLNDRIRETLKRGQNADSVDYWRRFFAKVAASDFLSGRTKDPWRCPGLKWFIKPTNFAKVIEGNYDNVRTA